MGREPYQPAYAFRTQRRLTHTDVKRAEGVLHGIGDRGWGGNGTAFAHALDAERIAWGGILKMNDLDLWYLARAGQQVVHQRPSEELAGLVIHELLIQPATNALRYSTADLAIDNRGIDDAATVVGHDIAQERDPAGLDVHFNEGHVHRTGIGDSRHRTIDGGLEIGLDRTWPGKCGQGGLHHTRQRHRRLWDAAHIHLSLVNLDVLWCCLHERPGGLGEFVTHALCRLTDRIAPDHRAAAGKRAD